MSESTYDKLLKAMHLRPFGVSEKKHKEYIGKLITKQIREGKEKRKENNDERLDI
jgi:hypothetical protein